MSALPFVDAHMHMWDLGRLRYAWLTPPFSDSGPNGNVAPIAKTYLLDDYLAEAAKWNVIGVVHVEAGAPAAQSLEETDWLQGMAAERGMPSGIVAFATLNHPNIDVHLAAQAERRLVRGIRHIVNWHQDPQRTYTPRDVTRDETWAHGFRLLAKYDLSFDLQAYPAQFSNLAELMAAQPETSVIINHAGQGVDPGAEGAAEWRLGMKALAALAHVSVKISGLGFAYRPWNAAAARDRVRETIDLFGVERCMFASDFPTDRLFASFDETLTMLSEAVSDFSESDRRALFARNANRIYRLGLSV
ncbi:MAG: amidohydrolase family protein [Pseudomonadota bacterium]